VPSRRPPAAELVDAVREFLERDLLPTLAGDRRFQCRVAINVLALVARELELGPHLDAREGERLAALLRGQASPAALDPASLDALNRELARLIREGGIDLDRPDLIGHLRETTRDALRINNPKWLDASSR
jgi:hypothetical protein